MPSVAFSKLVPGGNTTIILTGSSLAPDTLSSVSAKLMHPLHVQAEQVGALLVSGSTPHLQMMGGEFCVNATRSAALLLARADRLRSIAGAECFYGQITVSGMAPPVDILVSRNEDALTCLLQKAVSAASSPAGFPGNVMMGQPESQLKEAHGPLSGATRLFCAARMDCGAGGTRRVDVDSGACLMHLPGISHLLLDARQHPMPQQWRKASADWRNRTGLGNAPASGVVWYEHKQGSYRIWPAVEVKATASEHLETACGSASMAMALMHQADSGFSLEPFLECEGLNPPLPASSRQVEESRPLCIMQPSGESLAVTLQFAPGSASGPYLPAHAWVSGMVSLVAEGTAHL